MRRRSSPRTGSFGCLPAIPIMRNGRCSASRWEARGAGNQAGGHPMEKVCHSPPVGAVWAKGALQMSDATVTNQDREDLITVLGLRFGPMPPDVAAGVRRVHDPAEMDHLILAAANAATLAAFRQELRRPGGRLVGGRFAPLRDAARDRQQVGP